VKTLINILLLFFSIQTLNAQTPNDDPHWEILWLDQFNNLDLNKWEVKNNYDHWGSGPTVFVDDNVSVSNGKLALEIKQESYSCPTSSLVPWGCFGQMTSGSTYSYTSGTIETRNLYNMKYGYLEARIKIPYGNGFWPSLWTYYEDNNFYEEIDVFEMIPGLGEGCSHTGRAGEIHNVNMMTTNVHIYHPADCEPQCDCAPPYQVHEIDNYLYYHTYGLEWSPNKLIFYVDGKVVRNTPNIGIHHLNKIIIGIGLNPIVTNGYDHFPSKMYVDHVAVYKLRNDCNTSINTCSFDFNTHDNKVKKNITIGGSGCYNTAIPNSNNILRAKEFIIIKGDFTVPLGEELYLDVNTCY